MRHEVFRRVPRTSRLFHWDWDEHDIAPWLVILVGLAIVAAVIRVAFV